MFMSAGREQTCYFQQLAFKLLRNCLINASPYECGAPTQTHPTPTARKDALESWNLGDQVTIRPARLTALPCGKAVNDAPLPPGTCKTPAKPWAARRRESHRLSLPMPASKRQWHIRKTHCHENQCLGLLERIACYVCNLARGEAVVETRVPNAHACSFLRGKHVATSLPHPKLAMRCDCRNDNLGRLAFLWNLLTH